ncbi:EF-hand domain-containing protein [Streptomyces sp. NBC_00335]|uniref:EF-hand domain-containing protein n=1 Tax=unclassified Streptomyces TaxID=2593676 RepID=UPI002251DC47|nr:MULTISPECIES: EF-hand domain-containing protein [unclassified Streptomyces]MCX5406438.1 EF-hand domain-containing protein [Streptomyces sp. NBC_00086]
MDSAEYERKIAARFATFDQDGSGYIDREDFSTAAKAVLAEFAVAARSDRGQAVFAGAEAFWQGMAGIADVDGDQRVSREEFVTGAAKRLRDNPHRFAEIARPFLRAVIAVASPAGDAVPGATPAATARVLRVLGTAEELAGPLATALDADGDGRISEDEILAAFAGYCGVAAPDA